MTPVNLKSCAWAHLNENCLCHTLKRKFQQSQSEQLMYCLACLHIQKRKKNLSHSFSIRWETTPCHICPSFSLSVHPSACQNLQNLELWAVFPLLPMPNHPRLWCRVSHPVFLAGEHSISDGADCTEQRIEAKEIILHPSYGYNGHDIAIIKLKTGLQFNKYVQPACLPTSYDYQVWC